MMQALPTAHVLKTALRINAEYGFLYLNNPKVGCSTIKTSLWKGVRGKAPSKQEQVHVLEGSPFENEMAEPAIMQRAFVFTFVRNPFQRLVSAYLNKVELRADTVWHGFATKRGLDPEAPVSFDEFVEIITNSPPEQNDPHWRPQHLNALYPLVTPNLVAELESLNDLLPGIMTRLFGPNAPQMAQQTSHKTAAKQSWRSYFGDAGTVARARQFFVGDFEAFGYRDAVEGESRSGSMPRMSDNDHPELARLAAYLRAAPEDQSATLNAMTEPSLQDWALGQRLLRPRLHQTTLPALLQTHAGEIAASPYLRRVAATVQAKREAARG
jgi:hypothetical protein